MQTGGSEATGDDGHTPFKYGLGIMTVASEDGSEMFGHSGSTPGYRSYTFFHPKSGVTATLLSNNGGLSEVAKMWSVFEKGARP